MVRAVQRLRRRNAENHARRGRPGKPPGRIRGRRRAPFACRLHVVRAQRARKPGACPRRVGTRSNRRPRYRRCGGQGRRGPRAVRGVEERARALGGAQCAHPPHMPRIQAHVHAHRGLPHPARPAARHGRLRAGPVRFDHAAAAHRRRLRPQRRRHRAHARCMERRFRTDGFGARGVAPARHARGPFAAVRVHPRRALHLCGQNQGCVGIRAFSRKARHVGNVEEAPHAFGRVVHHGRRLRAGDHADIAKRRSACGACPRGHAGGAFPARQGSFRRFVPFGVSGARRRREDESRQDRRPGRHGDGPTRRRRVGKRLGARGKAHARYGGACERGGRLVAAAFEPSRPRSADAVRAGGRFEGFGLRRAAGRR